jgi:hypothetical protein
MLGQSYAKVNDSTKGCAFSVNQLDDEGAFSDYDYSLERDH